MHIALLIAPNRYQSTRFFAQGLAAALKRASIQVSIIEVSQNGLPDLMDSIELLQPDSTLSFSDLYCGGFPLQSMTKIPHFSYLLDPALYFLHQIEGGVSCCDEGDVELLHTLGCPHAFFLPLGVETNHVSFIPLKDRTFDCVYFGSCLPVEEQLSRWQKQYTSSEYLQLINIAEQGLTTLVPLWQLMQEARIPEERFLTIFHELEHFIRAQDRLRLLKAIPQKRLAIWGEGPWSTYFPYAKCYPAVSFTQMLSLIGKSKFVLNSSIRFKRGIHERIFYAFQEGAIPISNYSTPLNRDYSDHFVYAPGDWQSVQEKLFWLEKNYESVWQEGQNITQQKHGWDQRVNVLLAQIEQFSEMKF